MNEATQKPWDSVNPLLQPTAVVEVRGAKVNTIKWADKTTKIAQSMDKYSIAGEFEDGTQITLSQLGRDFTGQYAFERGKRYVFALKGYEIDRDSINAEFAGVAPADGAPAVAPRPVQLPQKPEAAKAA